MGGTDVGRAERVEHGLQIALWSVFTASAVVGLLVGPWRDPILQGGSLLIFALLLARLVTAAVAWPVHRRALLALAGGVLLWGAGSAQITVGGAVAFPSTGELLFLASYLCFAGYLFLDAGRRTRVDAVLGLDTVIVVGGAACVTGMLFLTPLVPESPARPGPLLLSLLFPLLDVVLFLIVAAQAVLRRRAWSWRTLQLACGFLLLALADLSLISAQAHGTYNVGPLLGIAWGLSLLLIVGAACSAVEEVSQDESRGPAPALLVSAAAVALLVLAWPQSSTAAAYLKWPAVITLAATGARLVLALRQARTAAEELRLDRTDDLTGLPNRAFLLSRLTGALAAPVPVTLLIVDVDGFKEINDSLGHQAGDGLLRLVADRIRDAAPSDVVVVRLGGDDFALLMVGSDNALVGVELGQRVRRALRQPARLSGLELVLQASVGVSTSRDGDADTSELLRRADVALHQAKAARAGVLQYDAVSDVFSRDRLQLAEDLRRAIDDGGLEVWYQPQVHAATERVCGLEALVRWRHPTMGLVTPGMFLPAARRAGLMLGLSEFVARTVVDDARRWSARGLDVPVSVNVAPPELLGHLLLPRMYAMVREARLRPGRIVVEVTEDSFLAEPAHAREVLLECRENGLLVSVDDFGTGFSSLAYLRDLPLDELKIDRSFVASVVDDERARRIVAFTTELAHTLDARVVAEGLEDATTMAEVVAMGIDVLQGYHIARPMPAAEVEAWVRGWERAVMERERTPDGLG